MKTGTHQLAAQHDHPGEWTLNDCEAARLQANELARLWGARRPTPDQAWASRAPITTEERTAFRAAVHEEETQARRKQATKQPPP